ncbi:Fic family protein [Flavitalea sp.]|nr:Fic family protein [Flavitalea sp.]
MEKLGDSMKIPERPPLLTTNYDYSEVINELVRLGKLEEFTRLNDVEYFFWDKWKYISNEWGIDPLQLWSAVKTNRLSHRPIESLGLPELKFKIGAPSIVQKYLHEFDLNIGGSIQADSIIPSADRDRYLIGSLMEEAIASSQLEGAATSRKVAKDMLENNRKPRNASEQMILNNYEAMKWIVENKHQPLNAKRIKYIHEVLTRGTLSDAEVGSFRHDDETKVLDTQTGKILHSPPTYTHLNELIEGFCNFANDKNDGTVFLHPITKGIILHFLIGYIHPFADGNGRTARTIFYWYLLKKNYWLIEYMSVSKAILNSKTKYAKAYLHTEFDSNDLTYFLVYNLKAMANALKDLEEYIKKKTAEKKNISAILRNTMFNERQVAIIQEALNDGAVWFTVTGIENKFGVSNQTARNDLNVLVAGGVFEERKAGKRSQFFPVHEYMKKLRSSQRGY